ncbi:hypothetical protein BH11PAT1_BH11PAT1_6180 [soil metagenome]
MNGKFIVIYGANNLGKTTQITMLQEYLQQKGIVAKQVKYPLYKLEPTGPIINAVLREGKEMEEHELQKLYVQNRLDFEPQLRDWLSDNVWVIAEDYVGTGIAWGMVRGVSLPFLEEINAGLYPADISILLYGERFLTGRETHNRNEADDAIWHKAQANHEMLGEKYGWQTVNANQSRDEVQRDIIKVIDKYIKNV